MATIVDTSPNRPQLENAIIQSFPHIDPYDLQHLKNIISLLKIRPLSQRQQFSGELHNLMLKLNTILIRKNSHESNPTKKKNNPR